MSDDMHCNCRLDKCVDVKRERGEEKEIANFFDTAKARIACPCHYAA